MTKNKALFVHNKQEPVKLYVCGITPYDKPHLGHGRVYVTFDLLYRLLMFLGYEVIYVRNFTDIEDKILSRAAEQNCHYQDIACRFIGTFHDAMTQLNCLKPTHEPRVTEYNKEIIVFIEKLIAQGYAYQLGCDVYFDVTKYASYGKLSKRNRDEFSAGARVAINDLKKNSEDFALWKGNNEGKFWQSPWGYGRPGWHIECSVMAHALLGESIDIHGGGMDLIFPHHENEIAQSESLFKVEFSRFWVHNAFINVNKEKMSKSLGNFVTLEDLFTAYDPMLIRFYFLQHHYRKPLEFNNTDLQASEVAYKKICHILHPVSSAPQELVEDKEHHAHGVIAMLLEALCDDLNTPKFLGIFFEHLPALQSDEKALSQVKYIFTQLLALSLEYKQSYVIDTLLHDQEHQKKIALLLAQRDEARRNKEWQRADQLREELRDLGYEVQDKKA